MHYKALKRHLTQKYICLSFLCLTQKEMFRMLIIHFHNKSECILISQKKKNDKSSLYDVCYTSGLLKPYDSLWWLDGNVSYFQFLKAALSFIALRPHSQFRCTFRNGVTLCPRFDVKYYRFLFCLFELPILFCWMENSSIGILQNLSISVPQSHTGLSNMRLSKFRIFILGWRIPAL